MTRRVKTGLAVASSLLMILAATAAFSLADVSSRAGRYKGRQTGEVLVAGRVVMSFRTSAGGRTPLQRAETAASRLAAIPEGRATPAHVGVRRVSSEEGVYIDNNLVASVSTAEARAHGTNQATLAAVWRDSLVRALGGEPARSIASGRDGARRSYYEDWTGTKQKWVPILSVANNGVRIGAAQIAGPPAQVDQVKAVAQLQLEFHGFARIYAYVPVSSLSVTRLDRVQGVSVWATGDLNIVRF